MGERLTRLPGEFGLGAVGLGALAGASGGLAGAWAMNAGRGLWPAAAREDEVLSEEIGAALARRLGRRAPSARARRTARALVHYGYGLLAGAAYGALAEGSSAVRTAGGAGCGAALWALGDGAAVPILAARSRLPAPLPMHLQSLLSHVVYGLATEAVRRGARAGLAYCFFQNAPAMGLPQHRPT